MPPLLRRIRDRFHIDVKPGLLNDYLSLNIFAVLIGMACGLLALAFRYLIWGVQSLAYNGGVPIGDPWANPAAFDFSFQFFANIGPWLLLILPVGGLIVGLLTTYLAKEAKGPGIAEVMEAIQTKGGRVRPRVIAVKALASSVSIGTGGSAGREGPIVQMGSAVGSVIGQRSRLSDTRIKILLSCGAAGAIAATFHAPIAGVLFSLELILLEFRTRSFIPIVVSAVVAATFMGVLTGNPLPPPLFAASYEFQNPLELPMFLLLGLVAGLMAILFIKLLYGTEDFFEKLKIKPYLKPAIGGLLVAVIGLGIPHVLGVGYDSIRSAVAMNEGMLTTIGISLIGSLVLLMVVKIVATSLTLGSGGSGGVFAPSLFIGAMLGGAFGIGMHFLFPSIVASNSWGAYALVGMGAFFAGASRATLTSIVIVFELTGDYRFILPLMLACVVADGVAILTSRHTIYTEKLKRRGIRFTQEMQTNVLEMIPVEDAMIKDPETITEETSVGRIANRIIFTGYHGFPVLNEKGELVGVVAQEDVRRALKEGRHKATAADVETRKLILSYPDENLNEVLEKMALSGIGRLPVVSREDEKRLVGFITRSDIIKAHRKKVEEEGHAIPYMRSTRENP
ncbi:MAG: chloride channel protein [Methanobacteriota archaeon]|nr:MAG: chloride channel protein [Euryarchaeota archaeon]